MVQSKKKKRSREHIPREEQHQAEQVEKFSRLQYNAGKLIKKEAKVVKAFECKKITKKVKALRDELSTSKNSTNDTKHQQKIEKLEFKLKASKEFDLEKLVDVCMQRLGIDRLDPRNRDGKEKKAKTESFDSQTKDIHENLIETILQHKKVVSALDEIDKKVVSYRTWVEEREKKLLGDHTDTGLSTGNTKSKKRKLKNKNQPQISGDEDFSALFVDSLSGAVNEDVYDDSNEGDEGYDDDFYLDMPKKKNRKGQRARKAKALAVEARKAGRVWDSSINWRPKKSKDDTQEQEAEKSSASGLRTDKKVNISDVAEMGKSWKEEGKAHPSWAAREAQKAKSGITQFSGKKITFDD